MKNRTTQNPKHQPPEQNPEKGTEAGIPEAHHHTPVYSKDSRRTDPLYTHSHGLYSLGVKRKEGGVFERLGRKEPVTSARSDSHRRSPQAQRTDVETRRRQQRQTRPKWRDHKVQRITSERGLNKLKDRKGNDVPKNVENICISKNVI
ncbi:hypothetical protein Tco_0427741 [Tanacetum coccineum]